MKTKFNGILTLLLAFMVQITFAQEKTISGTVTDESGPLPGVNVIIKNSTVGTDTDFDGNYTITAKVGDVLVFSYVGMKTIERTVGTSNTINVTMAGANQLEEVVVVAYGTQKKESLTGAVDVVSSEDLEMRTLTSPIGAIEGTTTGVQVLSASGQPGSSPSIVIRGVGTLNGSSDPLFVVDGVQFEGGLNNINQDDIESMTILKDAASTSLYGSRAANGVVIITTKKGKKNSDIQFNVTSQYGVITKGIDEYDAVSPGEYYELMWQSYKNSLGTPDAAATASANIYNRLGYNPFDVPNDQIVDINGNLNPNANVIFKGLNWYDELEQTGSRESNSLTISGGGEKHNLFFSASNLDEKGYVITSSYKRTTSRIGGSFSPKEWLTVGGNVNLALSTQEGPFSRGASIANPFSFAKDMGSIYPVYYVDPATGDYILGENGEKLFDRGEGLTEFGIVSRPTNVGRHAIEEALLNSDVRKTNNLGFRYNADFKIVEGLTFSLNYGQDIQDYLSKMYENNEIGDGAPTARYRETRYRRTVENFNQIINYNKSLGNHNFELTLGHESFDRHYSQMFGFKNTQTAAGIYEFDNFSVAADISGYSSDKKLEGYFSRLNYNYDNKYYLTGSVRRDGTSVFTNNKWGTFYSVGGSWRIDKENFMQNVSFINNLKLRASYGEVGNDDLGNYYIAQALYALYPNAGEPGAFWDTTGNDNLQWETIESWDVALDFGLFNNRVDGSIEYYKKNSSDLLYNVPIPMSEGQSEAPDNIGDMYNEGFELTLNTDIIQKDDFSWKLGLQASTLKNEITFLPSPFITGSKRWDAGRSRFDFYLYDYAGVDPSNGDALYYMYEPNPENPDGPNVPVLNPNGTHAVTNDWADANKGYVGASSVPDLIGSVSNEFNYKNFDFNFLFVYQLGGEVLDYGYAGMMHSGTYGASLHPDALNAWKNPGDITNVPRLENGDPTLAPFLNSRWLTDASYLALRNVNLAYNLGESVTDKIGVNKFRLFVSGENLVMFAKRKGLDPQYNLAGTPDGADYNPNRVISFGVNVSF